MTVATRIATEEYLRTSYQPDCELIDGELKEKPMPTRLHGYVQAMISHWFAMHMDEWGVAPESEVRTRIRPGTFRLPDVSVTQLETVFTKVEENPPIIAIEILSDDDRYSDLWVRAQDLSSMGVENIWLVDAEQRTVQVWRAGRGWELTAEPAVPGTPMYLDMAWLWQKVDKRLKTGNDGEARG